MNNETNSKPTGRPTKYKPEYNEQVMKLCRLGATDTELAEFFNVAESTINLWKQKEPEFSESIKRGKYIADMEVAEKLYKRATGYLTKEVHLKNGIITKEIVKEVPPDATAIIFWLTNRHGDKWKRKTESMQSGSPEQPLFPDITVKLPDDL